jgi:hypothetical protein
MTRFSRANENDMKATLGVAIEDWYDRTAETIDMPIVGKNLTSLMAAAALAVLLAVADTEDHLRDEDLLKEEKQ